MRTSCCGCPACHPTAPLLFPSYPPYYPVTNPSQVGYPKCVGDRVADNTTWFEVDGRDCMCDKGTLFCKKVRRIAASNHPLIYPCCLSTSPFNLA